jgi:hypothetical protein
MAAVSDGTNPGRSPRPQRQMPARGRNGAGEPGLDPTNQRGQLPSEIFGFAQHYSTGAPGSAGSRTSASTDVTEYDGQLEEGITGLSGAPITSTGAPGSSGASNSGGGETVTYTDFFGFMGQEHRESSTTGTISGNGDWTQFNSDGYAGGPTLPILQNARPTSTGAGEGRVRGMHP